MTLANNEERKALIAFYANAINNAVTGRIQPLTWNREDLMRLAIRMSKLIDELEDESK